MLDPNGKPLKGYVVIKFLKKQGGFGDKNSKPVEVVKAFRKQCILGPWNEHQRLLAIYDKQVAEFESRERRRAEWDTEARKTLEAHIKKAGLEQDFIATNGNTPGCVEVNLYGILRLLGVNFSKRP